MALYDLTLGPNGAYYIDVADLPVGIDATSSFSLAALVGNGKLLDDLIGAGGPPHTLGSHSDVTLTAPALNDVLAYNGSGWVNVPNASLADIYVNAGSFNPATMNLTLSDTDAGTPNVVVPLTHAVGNHSDVDTTTVAPIVGDRFRFDGANWAPWRPETAFGRINSTQDIRGPGAGTAIDFSSMSGTVGRNAGSFVAGGYQTVQAGTYRVRVQVAFNTNNASYSNGLRVTVNNIPQAAEGHNSRVRAIVADNLGGNMVEDVVTVAAGDIIGCLSNQDSGNNNPVSLVANASTFYIERLDV